METNNKASTSHIKPDSSDEEDEHHENFSTEELCPKVKTYRNLCLENEINVNNASSKSTTRIEDDNHLTAAEKPKRQNLMLTTNEKLNRTPAEQEKYTFNAALMNHMIPSLNYNELFYSSPSRFFKSLYSNQSLAEEMKSYREMNDKKIENDETIEIDKSFLELGDIISRGVMCPEFHAFVAERDKADNSNDDQLNCIEYHFDPKNHQFINNSEDSICDEPDSNKLDSTVFDELLECIDHVDREYSFFNPKLLAKWKGPNEWKTQAMAKALKSCTPSERNDIISNINGNIDESTQQNIKQTKTYNRDQVKNDSVKTDWLDMKQIDKLLKKNDLDKKCIPSRTLKKWNSLHNIIDTRGIVPDIVYKFKFLKYTEIEPDWWTSHKNCEEDSDSETSNSCQNNNDCSQTTVDTLEAMEIDYKVSEKLKNKNYEQIDEKLANLSISGELSPKDENVIPNIKTESIMDLRELKKEISDIIDEQCVETNTSSEWSSKLSFFNLLTMLRVNEKDGISIPKVFVGLIHLASERGLRLFQEHCTINDMEETFIVKPMNKE